MSTLICLHVINVVRLSVFLSVCFRAVSTPRRLSPSAQGRQQPPPHAVHCQPVHPFRAQARTACLCARGKPQTTAQPPAPGPATFNPERAERQAKHERGHQGPTQSPTTSHQPPATKPNPTKTDHDQRAGTPRWPTLCSQGLHTEKLDCILQTPPSQEGPGENHFKIKALPCSPQKGHKRAHDGALL